MTGRALAAFRWTLPSPTELLKTDRAELGRHLLVRSRGLLGEPARALPFLPNAFDMVGNGVREILPDSVRLVALENDLGTVGEMDARDFQHAVVLDKGDVVGVDEPVSQSDHGGSLRSSLPNAHEHVHERVQKPESESGDEVSGGAGLHLPSTS